MVTMLDKWRRDRKTAQAAKVQWLEDENAALRARDLIRDSTTEGEDEPADIPVRFCLPMHDISWCNLIFA